MLACQVNRDPPPPPPPHTHTLKATCTHTHTHTLKSTCTIICTCIRYYSHVRKMLACQENRDPPPPHTHTHSIHLVVQLYPPPHPHACKFPRSSPQHAHVCMHHVPTCTYVRGGTWCTLIWQPAHVHTWRCALLLRCRIKFSDVSTDKQSWLLAYVFSKHSLHDQRMLEHISDTLLGNVSSKPSLTKECWSTLYSDITWFLAYVPDQAYMSDALICPSH